MSLSVSNVSRCGARSLFLRLVLFVCSCAVRKVFNIKMKSVTKQSQRVGGVLTREVHLGVDGPLSIHLSDSLIMTDSKGQKAQFPADRVLELFGLVDALKSQMADL